MRPADEVHVVFVQELGHHVGPEGEGHAAVVLAPAQDVLVRVGPQQVAQQALVRHVRGPHDPPDLLHGLQVRGEAWGAGGRSVFRAELSFSLGFQALFFLRDCIIHNYYDYQYHHPPTPSRFLQFPVSW